MTTTTLTTLASLSTALQVAGFHRGSPTAAAAEIDAEVCRAVSCESCGYVGLDYHPFLKPGHYRALAACPACGVATEF